MVVTLGQQYNVGEKPTVMLYTSCIIRHAGTPDKNKTKTVVVHTVIKKVIIIYINCTIDLYTIKAYSLEHKQRCYNIYCNW